MSEITIVINSLLPVRMLLWYWLGTGRASWCDLLVSRLTLHPGTFWAGNRPHPRRIL